MPFHWRFSHNRIGFAYHGSVKHFGTTFVAFLCGLWLVRAAGEKPTWPAYALLAITALEGAQATIGTWQRPFSQAGAAAAWLRANHLENTLIAGVPTASTIGITEQLDRPLYQLECPQPNQLATFYLFTNTCENYNPEMLPERLRTASQLINGKSVILLSENPFTPEQIAAVQGQHMNVKLLTGLMGSEADRENFYLYVIGESN